MPTSHSDTRRCARAAVAVVLIALSTRQCVAADYHFDGSISRPVLEDYLARAITMQDLLTGQGNLDDNIRMLKNIGAKFAGRTVYVWGGESRLPARLDAARQNAPKIHAA
ncbi:MAG: hypothetical protein JXO22_04540, partial [Phycisphaerae bacterium]|nr:hypothetical protein [Phycisphaerae bacterium]